MVFHLLVKHLGCLPSLGVGCGCDAGEELIGLSGWAPLAMDLHWLVGVGV
jgi:hypothetical protein